MKRAAVVTVLVLLALSALTVGALLRYNEWAYDHWRLVATAHKADGTVTYLWGRPLQRLKPGFKVTSYHRAGIRRFEWLPVPTYKKIYMPYEEWKSWPEDCESCLAGRHVTFRGKTSDSANCVCDH